MIREVSLLLCLWMGFQAQAAVQLKSVSYTSEQDQTVIVYDFSEAFDASMIQTSVQEQSIQLIFPNVEMVSDKNAINVGQNGIVNVESTPDGADLVRSKVSYEALIPSALAQENLRVTADKNLVKVYLPKVNKANAGDQQKLPEVAHSGKVIKESDIPVLANKSQNKSAESGHPFLKLIGSLVLVGLMVGGLIYFSKWYSRKNKKTVSANKIRVLTQHYLGPRKQLIIVRVAGESLLLGVTDQNITMLKSLSLIDDEIPTEAVQSFGEELIVADKKQNKRESTQKNLVHENSAKEAASNDVDEFLIGSIKDKISTTLKGMREL